MAELLSVASALQLNMEKCSSSNANQRWLAVSEPLSCGHSGGGPDEQQQQQAFRLQLAGTTQCVALRDALGEAALTLSKCGTGSSSPLQLVNSTDKRAGAGFICGCEANATNVCDESGTAPCCLTVVGGNALTNYAVNGYRRCVGGPPCGNQQWDWAAEPTTADVNEVRLRSVRDGLSAASAATYLCRLCQRQLDLCRLLLPSSSLLAQETLQWAWPSRERLY